MGAAVLAIVGLPSNPGGSACRSAASIFETVGAWVKSMRAGDGLPRFMGGRACATLFAGGGGRLIVAGASGHMGGGIDAGDFNCAMADPVAPLFRFSNMSVLPADVATLGAVLTF